jgi:hypothetical protein
MNRGVLGRCGLLVSVVLLSGCRTDEDRCATLCEYSDKCTTLDVDCTEYKFSDCSEDVDDLTDSCHEAFDSVTNCLDENENDCDEVREHCQGVVDELFEQCPSLT